jgi:hypothetical protein
MIFRHLPWRGLTVSASRFLPCLFQRGCFPGALNDLLQLLDPFPGECHFDLKLMYYALFQPRQARSR